MLNPLKLQEMLGQAKQMQEQIQQKLATTVVEASSGGGAVTVKMNGRKEVLKVSIDPVAVTSLTGPNADVEMLEGLRSDAFQIRLCVMLALAQYVLSASSVGASVNAHRAVATYSTLMVNLTAFIQEYSTSLFPSYLDAVA